MAKILETPHNGTRVAAGSGVQFADSSENPLVADAPLNQISAALFPGVL